MMKICLCIIVKNEQKNIKRCLKSVEKFIDEVVIIDTGSNDLTKSICYELGYFVHDFKWTGDFSQARNFSIEKTTADWLLFLDADEVIEISDIAQLRKYVENSYVDIISLKMSHYYGKKPYTEERAHFSYGLRLVKNENIGFAGKIHERLETEGKTIGYCPSGLARILHYGYTEQALKSKQNRNLSMLNESVDGWENYYLAAEYYKLGEAEKAQMLVNKSIIGFLKQNIKPPALVYKLKYDMLIAMKNYASVHRAIENAVELYPDYVDLHYYKGISQLEFGEYEKAITSFSYCLILGESNHNYLILSGCGSFLSLKRLAQCYEKLNNNDCASLARKSVSFPHIKKK